ncbi:hypothetical protein [Ruminococcus sp.]
MKPYTEEMLLFLSEPDSKYYARLLLPEIAAVLGVTVAQLENKPIDIQIMLAQTYINCWHSDNCSIKKALEQDLYVDDKEPETENQETIKQKNHEMERTR